MLDTFNGGYTKALVDVLNWFEGHSEDLKFHKMFNCKGVIAILKALIDHREELRVTGDAELRFNRESRKVF